MKKNTSVMILLTCIIFMGLTVSCDDDGSIHKEDIVRLSTKEITAKVDNEFSVVISLSEKEKVHSILIEKTRDGKKAEEFTPITLATASTQFPYTFTDVVKVEDEDGIPIYSFYGLDANGKQVDATDLMLSIDFTPLKRLMKFDWLQASYKINGQEMLTDGSYAEFTDDVYRFNVDHSWECDWGENAFLATLVSFCGWNYVGTETQVDSIFTVKYELSASWAWEKAVTGYEVIKLEGKELTLKTITKDGKDLVESFSAIAKSSGFTPYRGADPAGYKVADCNPGSY